ncbi:MAG: PEP-utilizing enzyme [Gammaproteobacteria bacterium]|jgi:phosphohistidine swiveling domain-containing protein
MSKLYVDTDKYGYLSEFASVEAYNCAIKDVVRKRFEESGVGWEEFVFGVGEQLISKDDMQAIEDKLLALGYRFEPSAMSSPLERPDAYKDSGLSNEDFYFEHKEAPIGEIETNGRELRGSGDNVVNHVANLNGIARYVRTSDKVLEYLKDGVPEETIAIVDDSGGTLTAPILEQFKGVLCAGGTTRSHLAILTREYNIPCLMNVNLNGIKTGELIEVEVTAPSKTADDYSSGTDVTARIWRLHN